MRLNNIEKGEKYMQKTLRRRIIACFLSFSILIGCIITAPGVITHAATDKWSNVTDGEVDVNSVVQYTGEDLASNQYVSSVKFDFGKAVIGNNADTRMKIIYD